MTLSTLLIVAECRTRVTYELSDGLALRRFSLSRVRDNKQPISFPSSYYIYVMSFVLRKIVHAINKLSSNRIKSVMICNKQRKGLTTGIATPPPSPPLSHHALLNTPPLAPGNVFHKSNFSHLVPRIYEMRQTAYAANETTCKRMLMSVSILIKLRLV